MGGCLQHLDQTSGFAYIIPINPHSPPTTSSCSTLKNGTTGREGGKSGDLPGEGAAGTGA